MLSCVHVSLFLNQRIQIIQSGNLEIRFSSLPGLDFLLLLLLLLFVW